MFSLKISVPWGMGVTPDHGAEMLYPVMYCCSPPQEGCIWDVLLLILFHAGKKRIYVNGLEILGGKRVPSSLYC